MSKSKVAIVGAGNIGTMIANMLPENDYDITVVDSTATALIQKRLIKTKVIALDILKTGELAHFLQDEDYVINAGPYFLGETISRAAFESKTNYFDLTEDIQQAEQIKKLAAMTDDIVFVPQCGLAPGFISIIANHLAKKFDTVEDIEMRVGALPMYPSNELKYNMTWSTEGLVNEYLHTCHAIQDGEMISLQPLEGYETFSIDGIEYEAFNTSGGLGTLCETWMDNVKNMNYKTVRYPGHRYLMRFLIDEMKLGENNGKALKKLMNNAIPATEQDVVLIFVTVSGIKGNRKIQETWTRKIYGDGNWSAIQLTTSAGICGMVELHRIGKMPKSGFIKQEDIDFNAFSSVMKHNFKGIYS